MIPTSLGASRPSTQVRIRPMLVLLATFAAGSCCADGWQDWAAGRIDEAQETARRALVRDPADDSSRHLLVLALLVEGRHEDGLRQYAQLNPDYSRLKELDDLVLEAYQSLRRYDLATTFAKANGKPDYVVDWLETLRTRPMRVSLGTTTVIPFAQDQPIRDLMPAVPIEINGRRYLGHLDTGGSYVAMSPKMASELDIETAFIGEGQANAQQTKIEAGLVDKLRIGDATLENVPAVALSALQGALQSDGKIEDLVILGTNVLEQFLTTWDNENQQLVLSPRFDPGARQEHFEKYVGANVQPMTFYMVPDHYMIARGAVADREAVFFVDTGFVMLDPKGRQPALLLSRERLKKLKLVGDEDAPAFFEIPGTVRLGTTEIPNLIARVNAYGSFSFGGIKLDALLAHGFMKHCVWTLDFDTRRWFVRSFRTPTRPDTTVSATDEVSSAEIRTDSDPASAELRKYAGLYGSERIVSEIKVTVLGAKLRLAASGNLRGTFVLKKTAEDDFQVENSTQELTVKFNVIDGRAVAAEVWVGGQGPFVFDRQ